MESHGNLMKELYPRTPLVSSSLIHLYAHMV